MSTINKNWPRWFFSSVSKHFYSRRNTIPMFIEGQYRQQDEETKLLELRMDGPYFTEISRGLFRCFVEINVLAQASQSDSDFHIIHDLVGIAAAAFTDGIQIFKYGPTSNPDNDGSLLVCLSRIDDARGKERVQISHFGKIETQTPVIQATVEGHYEGFITL